MSLVPSVTETLLAWGITPIGVTRFCEQPALPQMGGTKDPDVAAVIAAQPDLVVMCDEENRRQDADALSSAGLAVHVVAIRAVADVAPALAELAGAVGAVPPASAEASAVAGGTVDAVAGLPPLELSAFVPIWRRPWMTLNGDTYGSSLLAALGVTNVFAADPDRYPATTLDEAGERRPAVVLAPSEPYPFRSRHVAELEQVAPVVLVDGQDLFWWGVRTPGAAVRLHRAVGEGWRSALSGRRRR